jgi:hypothetical protein
MSGKILKTGDCLSNSVQFRIGLGVELSETVHFGASFVMGMTEASGWRVGKRFLAAGWIG